MELFSFFQGGLNLPDLFLHIYSAVRKEVPRRSFKSHCDVLNLLVKIYLVQWINRCLNVICFVYFIFKRNFWFVSDPKVHLGIFIDILLYFFVNILLISSLNDFTKPINIRNMFSTNLWNFLKHIFVIF